MWLHYWMRALISVVVGIGIFVMFVISPALWDSALLAGWDAGVLTWLILTFLGIGRVDAQRRWNKPKPWNRQRGMCWSSC